MKENLSMPVGRLGKIFLDAGKITEADALKIVQYQLETQTKFGDAALALNMITAHDLQEALSSQFDFQYLKDRKNISSDLVAAYDPYCAQTEAYRLLRTQLLLRCFDGSNRLVAIVTSDTQSNSAQIASNLAIVFSQLGKKTLLIDADMTESPVMKLFGLNISVGLSNCLAQRSTTEESIVKIDGFDDLSVLFAGSKPPNPQELLSKAEFSELLNKLVCQYEIILVNSAAIGERSDASLISTRCKDVVVIAKKNLTQAKGVKKFTKEMRDAGVNLVGGVLSE